MANWCTALTLLSSVPGRLVCHLVSPWLLHCCSVTHLCPQSSFSLHHVCAGFGICAQDRSLIVEVSHHFGPTADIRRGSLSRCLAGYSTHPHHHSQGRPRCPGPSNFLRRPVPTTSLKAGRSSEIGSRRYPVVYRTSSQGRVHTERQLFQPLVCQESSLAIVDFASSAHLYQRRASTSSAISQVSEHRVLTLRGVLHRLLTSPQGRSVPSGSVAAQVSP